jgi:5-methylcytosine-specific restriction endonuclease McrA
MLIALTNIAIEQGHDDGRPMDVDLNDVAREFACLYWPMTRPFSLPSTSSPELLLQNRERLKPLKVLTLIKEECPATTSSYRRIRTLRTGRDTLIAGIRRTLARDVLYRLQSTSAQGHGANRSERFLYDHPESAAGCARLRTITLKPGVSACLRQFRGVVVAVVQARWAQWIREHNPSLGPTRALETFMFGADRVALRQLAGPLWRLQGGRCFYNPAVRLADPERGHVDHFIPWSRYPCDSPFNLVLACSKANISKRNRLAAPPFRDRWLARNQERFELFVAPPKSGGFGADPGDQQVVHSIADWAYRTAAEAKARLWNGSVAV